MGFEESLYFTFCYGRKRAIVASNSPESVFGLLDVDVGVDHGNWTLGALDGVTDRFSTSPPTLTTRSVVAVGYKISDEDFPHSC